MARSPHIYLWEGGGGDKKIPEERHVCDERGGAAEGEDAGDEGVVPALLPHRYLPDFGQQKYPRPGAKWSTLDRQLLQGHEI